MEHRLLCEELNKLLHEIKSKYQQVSEISFVPPLLPPALPWNTTLTFQCVEEDGQIYLGIPYWTASVILSHLCPKLHEATSPELLETWSRLILICNGEYYSAINVRKTLLQKGSLTYSEEHIWLRFFLLKHPKSIHLWHYYAAWVRRSALQPRLTWQEIWRFFMLLLRHPKQTRNYYAWTSLLNLYRATEPPDAETWKEHMKRDLAEYVQEHPTNFTAKHILDQLMGTSQIEKRNIQHIAQNGSREVQ